MAVGLIRAYSEENDAVGSSNSYRFRKQRNQFRRQFRTKLKRAKSNTSETLHTLKWGMEVLLPDGLSSQNWSKVKYRGKEGYIRSKHVIELAYLDRQQNTDSDFSTWMTTTNRNKQYLLWGDLIQIIKKGRSEHQIRCRGQVGKINKSYLTDKPLLEIYFIDVGQGDGVLVKTPDRKHLLIDGGMQRKSQQTGKNAADFIDWKFFFDYGDFEIDLDGMMASHSDTDHFGGLHDLVNISAAAKRELDCSKVNIKTFYHPGLSRWSNNPNALIEHKDKLGAWENGFFTQLLGDRTHAEKSVDDNDVEQLSGPWHNFIKSLLEHSSSIKVEPLIVESENLQAGSLLPQIWVNDTYDIKVLAPVSKRVNGKIGLKDLGNTGKNSNGHSICLRIDYGSTRFLLTGDLNKKSMDWIMQTYGDRMGQWKCDVAKACHHGSDDISYKFLEEVRAAATIISSGDAEGHAHPRPDIVTASAISGFKSIDRNSDKLITPLVYMTEIERSVSLGALNKIELQNLPIEDLEEGVSKDILARHLDEMTKKLRDQLSDETKDMEEEMESGEIQVNFNLSVPMVPFGSRTSNRRAWRSRVMEKNHYGLVNVRTDGETIVCATLKETGEKWTIHSFPGRF